MFRMIALSMALLAMIFAVAIAPPSLAENKPLTFVDLMKFRTIPKAEISEDGSTLAYQLQPDRGDGEVVVVRTDGSGERRIALGADPQLSPEGRWLIATLKPTLEAIETAEADPPEPGLALLEVATGDLRTWAQVKTSALSEDGRFLAVQLSEKARQEAEEAAAEESAEGAGETVAGEQVAGGEEAAAGEAESETESTETESTETESEGAQPDEAEGEEAEETEERRGTTLILLDLESGTEIEIADVAEFAFAEASSHLAYAVAAEGGENGLFVRHLGGEHQLSSDPQLITTTERGHYSGLAWAAEEALLGFVASVDDEDGEPGDGELWIWQAASGEGRAVATTDSAPSGSFIPAKNKLTWSRDGERLFYGTKPRSKPAAEAGDDDKPFDPYDVDALLAEKGVDVWHVDDPLIKTNERKQWEEDEKDRTYLAVYHRGPRAQNVQLADLEARAARPSDNGRAVIAGHDVPYLQERTWEGFFGDLYWISLADGSRQRVAEKLGGLGDDIGAQLSPDGRFIAWYREPHWYLFDAESGTSRNLTDGLGISFADEDHDYPQPAGNYDLGGWLDDSSAVLIHDKYDVWSFPTARGETHGAAVRLTGGLGRQEQLKLRVVDEGFDEDDQVSYLPVGRRILLHGEREREKNHGFWQLSPDGALEKLVESDRQYRFRARALGGSPAAAPADRILFTRESYREFPDLRVAKPDFSASRRLSTANPQIEDFAWGHAELVNFTDVDGRSADAVLIRPETLEEGERCPVLVYYYRFFSQRLYSFNEPKVNHRPSFPVYASHGYCVFLPDIRFEIGRPGLSATKALVPAVQKIVDMGVADPEAIGLHGHSWSGYQTAFVVTQTNIFAAAVAGAPVSNMTSAYGGIRYGTGLARQFQYEMGQSRLGRSLWQARDLYIENSPLFYADRIETPLLLQFGDEDEAVPWTQGVELYLALRRLGKESVFLQYHGEPHHLKQYPNKLDYSIKMKEFFDHYLKGAPAPVWWSEGVPYRGEE